MIGQDPAAGNDGRIRSVFDRVSISFSMTAGTATPFETEARPGRVEAVMKSSPRSLVPPLRVLAALPPRDADILLVSAAHAARTLHPDARRRTARRIAAYRCVLGLPCAIAERVLGLTG